MIFLAARLSSGLSLRIVVGSCGRSDIDKAGFQEVPSDYKNTQGQQRYRQVAVHLV